MDDERAPDLTESRPSSVGPPAGRSANSERGALSTRPRGSFVVFGAVALGAQVLAVTLPGLRSASAFLDSCGVLSAVIGLAPLLTRFRASAWVRLLVPSGYLISLALLFSSQGTIATFQPLVLLPILWVACHRTAESAVVILEAVCVLVLTSLLAHASVEVAIRTAVLWGIVGTVLVLGARNLSSRLDEAIRGREEALRHAKILGDVARELNSTLDPERVVTIAVQLAAEIASPPGLRSRRANYCRISDGVVRVDAEWDANGQWRGATWPLAEHPLLAESVRRRVPTSGALDLARLGPAVRRLASDQQVEHGAWIPVVVDGELHGVLAVAGRNRPVSDEELSRSVAIVGIMELSLKNALAHQRAQRVAATDSLTTLANRRGMERLVRERRGRRSLAAVAIDVDRLKDVNDRHGHAAGDELLRVVADAIRSVGRAGDVVARVGGDEFACIVFDADEEAAVGTATRMLEAVRWAGHRSWEPLISIGVSCAEPGESLDDVLRRADAAMYQSKRAGGMRITIAGAEPGSNPETAGREAAA
jgi:diguanylate cyclase (GGDEF)-like protein